MSIFGNSELFAGFNSVAETPWVDDDSEDVKFYKEENEKLKTENEELRKALRIITQPSNIKVRHSSTDGPVAQVLLFNNSIAREEKSVIEHFFQNLMSQQKHHNDNMLIPQRSSLRCPISKGSCIKTGSRHERKLNEAFTITNSLQFYNAHFCCDHIGEPLENGAISSLLPEYQRAHLDPLDGEVEVEDDGKSRIKLKRCCFNCGLKDHQLMDCPNPKDYSSINRRKQEFLGQMNNSPQAGSNRYHADRETNAHDPRFSHFKAGNLSDALRDALNIGKNDLPSYIYQMRLMGYPPGHLEDAKIKGSGLSFYSGRNKKSKSGNSDVDGAPVDIDKLIDYPGFNTDPGHHIIDKCQELGMLPMDKQHSKEVMVSYHKHRNELLRKKNDRENEDERPPKRHKPNREEATKTDDVREVDMDTGDDGCPDVVDAEADVDLSNEEPKRIVMAKPSSDAEDSVAITTESEVVEYESPEEGEYDEVDAGDLNEEELQIRKEIILRKLKEEELSDDLIFISNEDPPIIDLTSDLEVVDEVVDLDSSNNNVGDETKNEDESSEDLKPSHHEEDSRDDIVTLSSSSPKTSIEGNNVSNQDDTSISNCETRENVSNDDLTHHVASWESPESPPMEDPSVDSCGGIGVDDSRDPPDQQDTLSSTNCTIPTLEENTSGSQGDSLSLEPGVPHRSKFAEGITEFGIYYVESKSKGVYKKLRKLLKDSPRRTTKNS